MYNKYTSLSLMEVYKLIYFNTAGETYKVKGIYLKYSQHISRKKIPFNFSAGINKCWASIRFHLSCFLFVYTVEQLHGIANFEICSTLIATNTLPALLYTRSDWKTTIFPSIKLSLAFPAVRKWRSFR